MADDRHSIFAETTQSRELSQVWSLPRRYHKSWLQLKRWWLSCARWVRRGPTTITCAANGMSRLSVDPWRCLSKAFNDSKLTTQVPNLLRRKPSCSSSMRVRLSIMESLVQISKFPNLNLTSSAKIQAQKHFQKSSGSIQKKRVGLRNRPGFRRIMKAFHTKILRPSDSQTQLQNLDGIHASQTWMSKKMSRKDNLLQRFNLVIAARVLRSSRKVPSLSKVNQLGAARHHSSRQDAKVANLREIKLLGQFTKTN